jgi:hypothetical protein
MKKKALRNTALGLGIVVGGAGCSAAERIVGIEAIRPNISTCEDLGRVAASLSGVEVVSPEEADSLAARIEAAGDELVAEDIAGGNGNMWTGQWGMDAAADVAPYADGPTFSMKYQDGTTGTFTMDSSVIQHGTELLNSTISEHCTPPKDGGNSSAG